MITEENYKLFQRGLKYCEKNPDKAIPLLKQFLKECDCKEAWLNLAVAYKHKGNLKVAGECLLKANDEKIPYSDGTFAKAYPTALNNLGLIAHSLEDDATAEQFYKACLAIEPLNYDCLWNLSVVKLKNYCSDMGGNLSECWRLYNYRFKRTGADPLKNAKEDLKLWNGLDKVKSIVCLSEQGMGDSIMYGRYLEKLKEYCDEVWIQCDPSLNYIFSDYNTCVDVRDSDATHGIPIGSLGSIMDYIPSSPWLAEKRVVEEHSGLRIGCVWAGNKKHINDKNRSITPFFFNKLRKHGELCTIGPASGPEPGFTHLDGNSWKETIENLGKLDLVITVDTSIAHMCGSLGMPCWVLMPLVDTDFRWGNSTMGFKNVWYPSISVFRNPGNWIEVFNNVERALCEV
jgi:hypothetical protein